MSDPAPSSEAPLTPAMAVRRRILRSWRIWQLVVLVALFGGFGGPPRLVPVFQLMLVVAASLPLVRGLRLVDGAELPEYPARQLRTLLWALSAPVYLCVVVLFLAR